MNTNGGGLSYMHSGMYGMYALQESIRQMRGIAPAQVEGVKILPGWAPIASTVVPGCLATPTRASDGSSTKITVPVGASTSCPSIVNVASPATTTYTS